MDFGLLHEMQVMRPWDDHSESRAYWESAEQAGYAVAGENGLGVLAFGVAIQGFQDAGATQMLMAMQLGTIPHEAVLCSIELFGREVIPSSISS